MSSYAAVLLAAGEDCPGKLSRSIPCSVSNWLMIDCFISYTDSWGTDFPSNTFAYGLTSSQDCIGVSLRSVRPPSISCLTFEWSPNPTRASKATLRQRACEDMAVAAHRNYILLRFANLSPGVGEEFFVYRISPPALQLLPACPRHRFINGCDGRNIGILCSRDDHRVFAVAHLILTSPEGKRAAARWISCPTATLCYIRGQDDWVGKTWCTIEDMPIRGAVGDDDGLVCWKTDAVLPFGDYICWVDYLRGMLFCNVLSRKPELHYVALPVVPYQGCEDPEEYTRFGVTEARSLSVTKEGDGYVLKFVDATDITRWFCQKPQRGSRLSRQYPTISSWTLSSDMRTWKLDAKIEEDEFLTLTERHNIPSRYSYLRYPFVDLNDPHTIYCAVGPQFRTRILAINVSRMTLDITPYTFEPTGEDQGQSEGKEMHLCNIDYNEPFLICELISNAQDC